MVITKEQHIELKQLKNKLAALLLEIDNNKVEDLLTIDEVGIFASELFDYSIEEIKGESRKHNVVWCRGFIIKFSKEELRLTDSKIADYIGRDRSTVTYSYTKFNNTIEEKPYLANQYKQFKIDLL